MVNVIRKDFSKLDFEKNKKQLEKQTNQIISFVNDFLFKTGLEIFKDNIDVFGPTLGQVRQTIASFIRFCRKYGYNVKLPKIYTENIKNPVNMDNISDLNNILHKIKMKNNDEELEDFIRRRGFGEVNIDTQQPITQYDEEGNIIQPKIYEYQGVYFTKDEMLKILEKSKIEDLLRTSRSKLSDIQRLTRTVNRINKKQETKRNKRKIPKRALTNINTQTETKPLIDHIKINPLLLKRSML